MYLESNLNWHAYYLVHCSDNNNNNPPHIIIAVVYIFIYLYFFVATAFNIWENNDIFLF